MRDTDSLRDLGGRALRLGTSIVLGLAVGCSAFDGTLYHYLRSFLGPHHGGDPLLVAITLTGFTMFATHALLTAWARTRSRTLHRAVPRAQQIT